MTNKTSKGFTLIELLTAVSIFAIIMTISLGSILGIFEANRKSRSLKTVMSNLNLALEGISKEIRFGENFHCGTSGTLTTPQNCPAGDTFMSFLSTEGQQITYRLTSGAIEKRVGSGPYIDLTAPELIIDSLSFYTLGAGADTLQPKVIIKVEGHAGVGRSRSNFTIQTLVSQRSFDN